MAYAATTAKAALMCHLANTNRPISPSEKCKRLYKNLTASR